MREILFKAKRKDNGEWVEGSLYVMDWESDYVYIIKPYTNASTLTMYELIRRNIYMVDKNTVCQYTGLTDKNGEKIWENDIVELVGTYSPFVCKWDEYIARFIFDNDFSSSDFNCYRDSEIEVIGNTFDGGLNDGKETEEN